MLQKEKHRCQTDGTLDAVEGIFSGLTGCKFAGYEIHMGQTVYCDGDGSDAKGTVDKAARPANSAESNRSAFCADDATRNTEITQAVIADSTGRIYGSYIHGLFDMGEIAGRMIQTLAREKGISLENGVWEDYRTIKERQYDKLADTLREYPIFYYKTLRIAIQALWPPKPRETDRARSRSTFLASFGQMSRSQSGSGSL